MDIPGDILRAIWKIDRDAFVELVRSASVIVSESLLEEISAFAVYERLVGNGHEFAGDFLARFACQVRNENELLVLVENHNEKVDFLGLFKSTKFPQLLRTARVLNAICRHVDAARISDFLMEQRYVRHSQKPLVTSHFGSVFELIARALDSCADVGDEHLREVFIRLLYLNEETVETLSVMGSIATDVFEFIVSQFSPCLLKRFTVERLVNGRLITSLSLDASTVVALNSPDFLCCSVAGEGTLLFNDSRYDFVGGIDRNRNLALRISPTLDLALYRKEGVSVDDFAKSELGSLPADSTICYCIGQLELAIAEVNEDLFSLSGLLFEKFSTASILSNLLTILTSRFSSSPTIRLSSQMTCCASDTGSRSFVSRERASIRAPYTLPCPFT
jgi:hypothetical protein